MSKQCVDIEVCNPNTGAAQFFEEFVIPARPAILRGAAANWPAVRKWTLLYFKGGFGSAPVVASHTKTRRKVRCTLGEYLELKTDERPFWYVTDWDFRKEHPKLLEDIQPLPHFQVDWINNLPVKVRPDLCWLFIGHAGTGTPVHVDNFGTSAWLAVVHGHKTLYFFKDGPLSDEEPWGQANLHPGDVVYVPAGSRHSATNRTLCISVTGNFIDGANFRNYRTFRMREWRGYEILASELRQLHYDDSMSRELRARHVEVALEALSEMVLQEEKQIEELKSELMRLRMAGL